MTKREVRIERDGTSSKLQRFVVRIRVHLVPLRLAPQEVIVGLQTSRLPFHPLYFCPIQGRRYPGNHPARDLILKVEDIFKVAVEAICPNMSAIGSVDELAGDADA